MENPILIEIGRVLKPRGLRGEFKVEPYSGDPERFRRFEYLYTEEGNRTRKHRVVRCSVQGKFVFLLLEGLESVEQVRPLTGGDLYIDTSQLPQLEEGEYLVRELLGCRVENMQGELLGQVRDLLEIGRGHVLEIETPESREVLIPFNREFVKEVELTRRLIRVQPLEGMV